MNARQNPLRVLVVDDEPVIAETFAAILLRDGHQAYTAFRAEEAVELAPQIVPDVVITDVVMREMTGIDLAIHLSLEMPQCRVLMISGDIRTAELLKTMEESGFNFPLVVKPVHPEEVLNFVKSQQRLTDFI